MDIEDALTIETITDADGFARLEGEWNELLDDSDADCLFLTWQWLFTWWRHLSEKRKLHIVCVRSRESLVAIAPLALRPAQLKRMIPFRALEFLGSGSVGSDYLDVILRRGREDAALRALASHLAKSKHMLELSQVTRASSHAASLVRELSQSGWTSARETTDVCPYIDLSAQSWDGYLSGLGRSHRYNVRRRIRKLEKDFDLRFERAESEADRREALSLLVDLHHKRWSERGGSDALHTNSLVEFHQAFTRGALDRGWLRLYLLRLNGEAAASLYGIQRGGTFYYYQAGFNPAYRKWSVGLVILGLAIKRAIEDGADEFDLLHGDESYKYLWASRERELDRIELYPPRTRGRMYRAAMEARCGMKKLIWRWLPREVGDSLVPGRRYDSLWDIRGKQRAT